jgi:hypothetical protein
LRMDMNDTIGIAKVVQRDFPVVVAGGVAVAKQAPVGRSDPTYRADTRPKMIP